MESNKQMLAAMAEIGALRNFLVQTVALRLLEEPDPLGSCEAVNNLLNAAPTMPGSTSIDLDPAMSDLLAAMTDERTAAIGREVRDRIGAILQT
ncbi:hypothetical protein [Amaricoccus tamworthensis]|uniref:hypothetical protein n=1 Tax=Amaricoccus tamworthensis TaxID=57002 RepID=UPI003C7A21A7